MSENNDFDVLLLGGNIIPPYKVVSDDAVQVKHSQTTIGYMVKKHYYGLHIFQGLIFYWKKYYPFKYSYSI